EEQLKMRDAPYESARRADGRVPDALSLLTGATRHSCLCGAQIPEAFPTFSS
ncbi:hypothetical protein A2U01_0114715, partial [Trifolium medium]|nr:hypothetical protein [Trifolium medium]